MESHENDLRSAVESDERVRAVQDGSRSAGLAACEVTLLDYPVKLAKNPRAVSRRVESEYPAADQVGGTPRDNDRGTSHTNER